jgi:hypothetical protein
LTFVLAAGLGALCLGWLALYGRLLVTLLRLPRLIDAPERRPDSAPDHARGSPADPSAPRVSLIVPARNEEEHIEAALRSLLSQDHPALEVIAVEDRSDDATGRILRSLAAQDPRLRVVGIDELPEGWLGKPHALAQGLKAATGDWLLLTDADVRMAPDVVRRAVALAERERVEHLAVFPDLLGGTFGLRVVAGTFGAHLLARLSLRRLRNPRSLHSIGVGAFNLVRRDLMERTPGFEWLRMEVADDLGLGRMVKMAGGRTLVVSGCGKVVVPWYRDVPDMIRGLEKNSFGFIAGYRPLRALALALGAATFALAPWLTLLLSTAAGQALAGPGQGAISTGARASVLLLPLGLSALLAPVACGIVGRVRYRLEILPALLVPLGLLTLSWSLLLSAFHGWRRGGIVWRGTFYRLSELRRGRRVGLR